MTERVVELDLGVEWEPNAPQAFFVADDYGNAVLALGAHFADVDQRVVVIRWTDVWGATTGYPNDEGRGSHRLYSRGLKDVPGCGVVLGSRWIPNPESGEMKHFIVMTKEQTFEVAARSCEILRIEGSTADAALAGLKS